MTQDETPLTKWMWLLYFGYCKGFSGVWGFGTLFTDATY